MEIEMSSIQEPQIVKPKDPPSVKIKEPDKADKYKIPPIDVTQAGTSMGAPKTPLSASMSARQDKERKIGHRRVNEAGEVTYKKKPTSELMAAVQLGIGQSIGGLASKPERDVLMQDFTVVESTFFPSKREGSNLTPAHHHSDFRFKTYAPIAFRYFREMFAIQPDDFLSSLVSFPLQELSNPGASGSIFYLSEDDEFIIKTVQHKEAEFLQKLLPGYYMNLNQNPRTLLPKFYGLYCYQCGGKNIRFTVMNNLLPTEVRMHEKYDLKGSTYKRKASKHERAKTTPTLKDLDFLSNHPDGLLLEAETYNAFHKTMARDCRVLESFKIMDFSLLVGIHNLDQAARDRDQQRHASSHSQPSRTNDASSAASSATPRSQLHRGKSVKQRLAAYSTAMESIQADSEPVELENEEDVPLGGIPARNSKGERLLLYVGIIDILQSYRLKKKLEHGLKSLVHDGDTISVHRPSFYCNRFQNFFANIVFKKIPSPLKHSPSKKKGVAGRLRSVTEGDITLKTPDKSGGENKQRSTSGAEEAGATGGRPDLLPTTSTPPPTFAEAVASSHSNSMSTTAGARSVGFRTSSLAESSVHAADLDNIPRSAYEQHRSQISPVSSGLADNDSMGMLAPSSHSPVHSISESTPTHTEYTEGTPSFTTSSPSCSSDVLDISLPDVHASVRDHHQRDGLDEQEVMQVSQLSTNSGESNVTVIYQQRGSVMTTTTTTTGHVATVTHSNGEQLSLIEGASKSQNSSSVAVGVGVVGRGCEESGDETSQETSYASAVESLATTTTAPPTHDSPTQKAPAQI